MAARAAAENPEQPPRLSCSRSGFWARQLQSGPDRTVRTSPTHPARPTARLGYLRTSSDSGSASRLRRRSRLQRQTTLRSAEAETTEPDRSRSTSWSRLQNQNQESPAAHLQPQRHSASTGTNLNGAACFYIQALYSETRRSRCSGSVEKPAHRAAWC